MSAVDKLIDFIQNLTAEQADEALNITSALLEAQPEATQHLPRKEF